MLEFASAAQSLLSEEGGYRNVTSDPGGETNWGITRRSYPHLDIKNLTRHQAVDIYYRDFWKRGGYASLHDTLLAYKVFSFAVNIGPSRSHKFLQLAINECLVREEGAPGIKVDGVFGPTTTAACNILAQPPESTALFFVFMTHVYSHYLAAAAKQPGEIKGWLNRLMAIPDFLKEDL